jgi:hypothetical protein
MIAASACFDHASIVAKADSFVGLGGFAENPIRKVRGANAGLGCTPGVEDVASLQDDMAERVAAIRTRAARARSLPSVC